MKSQSDKLFHPAIVVVFLIPFLVTLLFGTNARANCHPECLDANPGGKVPSTNSEEISNCTKISSSPKETCTLNSSCDNYSEDQCKDKCKVNKKSSAVTTKYCEIKTPSISTATGTIVIYASNPSSKVSYTIGLHNLTSKQSKTITVKSKSNYIKNPYKTGITINKGDKFYVSVVVSEGDGKREATGWRAYNESSGDFEKNFKTARAQALTNNHTIFSEQSWADPSTNSNYDSYDFNDIAVILAVNNPTPAPSCSSTEIGLNATNLYLGKIGNFSINTSSLSEKGYYYKETGNEFSPNIVLTESLNGPVCSLNSSLSVNCYIQNRVNYNLINYKTDVSWTNKYKVCADIGLTNCSQEECQAKTTITINPYPSFMNTTSGGTAYTSQSVIENAFPEQSSGATFTSQLFITSLDGLSGFVPATNISGKSKLIKYSDSNNDPGFYSEIRSKLLHNKEIGNISATNATYNDSDMKALGNEKINLIDVSGDLNIGLNGKNNVIYCYKPTIFLVSGNLIFNQQLQIWPGQDAACMFVVAGKTSFNISQDSARIDAFIISNTLNTASATTNIPGNLTIKGGVTLQGNNQNIILDKNINATVTNANDIHYSTSSEQIKYEGARYIKIFKEYLQEPTEINIREIQYTQN